MNFSSRRAACALAALGLLAAPSFAMAQASIAPASTAPVAPQTASVAPTSVKVPEGTELRIRFNDELSSGKNSEGDQFSITLDDDVDLGGGQVLKRGYRGKGQVTQVKKKGMMGQAGEMNVRLDYLKVGDTRIRLRGQKGGEGQGAMGATVALTILFGPIGLLKHGHDVEIHSGQVITAYVDEDAKLELPVTQAPKDAD
jgi:hypothetical protein